MCNKGLTIPEAIRKLFDVNVAQESPLLKNKANSLVRNGLIEVEKEARVQRSEVTLCPGQEISLHNALLLNALFPDPKDVKRIFLDTQFRLQCAELAIDVLKNRNSLLGQAYQSRATEDLANCLMDPQRDLRAEYLPNPFSTLPQVILGEQTNLLHVLLAQAASLDPADSFLLAYLKGDWKAAERLSSQVSTGSPELLMLKSEVDRKLAEAHEFNNLLNFFRKE